MPNITHISRFRDYVYVKATSSGNSRRGSYNYGSYNYHSGDGRSLSYVCTYARTHTVSE